MAKIDWDQKVEIEDQTTSYLLQGLRVLWKLIASQKKRFGIVIVLTTISSTTDLAIPMLFRELVDEIPTVIEDGLTRYIIWVTALMFIVRIGSLVVRRFFQEPIFARAIVGLENNWPVMAHKKLLALSIGFHESENTGKKIAKVNKAVERLVGILDAAFWQLFPSLFHLAINIPIIFLMDWRLGLFFFTPLVPAVWINWRCHKRFYPYWIEWEEKKEEAVGLFCQSIINIRTVQSFTLEKSETRRHGKIREAMHDLDVWIWIKAQLYHFVMELILILAFLGTICLGLYFTYRGWGTIGTVTYIFVTGGTTLGNIWGVINVYTKTMRHIISAERMQKLLEEPIDVANECPGIIPEEGPGLLAFEEVTHIYPGKTEPAISKFNLEINPGEMVAFAGLTGSGKSTLVSLLARVQDPTHGRITLDGVGAREVDKDWYRRHFAVVPQDVEIFEGSIRYNITLGYPDVPSEWIDQAIEAACLLEVVNNSGKFPEGLKTEVGEEGVKLSGGERQRVGIARAYVSLLSGARVLILDEATSSLDSQSEMVVQSFIEKLRQERNVTIVAIAHRLSTINQADRICVLENGRILELGDHARLMQRNGLYRKLVKIQNMRD